MTSLYDQYHSQKNIDHMYNLINDLIIKQGGNNIHNDIEFKKYYDNKLREIFIESDSENLVDLNKELLKHHILHYKNNNDIQKQKNMNANSHILNTPNLNTSNTIELENTTQKDNSDVKNQFDEYLKMRESPEMKPKDIESQVSKTNEVSFDDMMNDMNKEVNIKPIIKEEPVVEKVIVTSANRKDIQSNRFDYSVICNKEINKLERLIIPIENSIHFALPMLKLIIKELNIDINIYLKDTHILNNYTYGVYVPNNHNIVKNGELLTIKIQSIYDDSEYNYDIVEGKFNDDNNSIIIDDCTDFKINDIISINSKHFTKIIDISDNNLILEDIPLEKDESTYVMNMNLQNTLVFS